MAADASFRGRASAPSPAASPFNAFRRESRKMRFPRVSLSDMAFSPHGVGEQPIPLPYVFRPLGGRLRRDRLETGGVRVMAMSAQQGLLPPLPLSPAPSPGFPPSVP